MPSLIERRCRLLWTLARRHGWGAPVDETTLVDAALPASEQGRGREDLASLVEEPYLDVGTEGYIIANDPDSQALAAVRLESTCGYTRLQIEATLSRFAQAGGLKAYDPASLRRQLPPWE